MPARVFFLFVLFNFSVSAGVLAQQKYVGVRIIQEDNVYAAEQNEATITLQQKTFKLQVLLQHVKGVYVFASFNDSLFHLPAGQAVPGFLNLPDQAMAEEQYNKEKELLVTDDGWSYWFYDPGLHWHRFNKKITFLDSGRVVGTRTVKQLYLVGDQRSVKLKENSRPLYLFFVAAGEEDKNGRPLGELMRMKIKIDWRKED